MPWLVADARPRLTKGIVNLEPTGPPFMDAVFSTGTARPWGLSDAPITYHPPVTKPGDLFKHTINSTSDLQADCTLQETGQVKILANLQEIPVIVVTSESSFTATTIRATAGPFAKFGEETNLSEPP